MIKDPLPDDLVRILGEKLGASPSLSSTVVYLIECGVIDRTYMRIHVVGSEFFRKMAEPEDRTASDIEHELAARYDLTKRRVQQIREEYRANRRRSQRGVKTK